MRVVFSLGYSGVSLALARIPFSRKREEWGFLLGALPCSSIFLLTHEWHLLFELYLFCNDVDIMCKIMCNVMIFINIPLKNRKFVLKNVLSKE